MSKPSYQLTIDLNTLNHLGINLYSNIPAVVSEVVANAWDADATTVSIEVNKKDRTVTIIDDGFGMSESDINEKYLRVGYLKRERDSTTTPLYDRHVMGRKGIGKLALFSIANTIEVQSAKREIDPKKRVLGKVVEKNGFIMVASKIKEAIGAQKGAALYEPDVIARSKLQVTIGTKIVLRDLKNQGALSDRFLRTRLARRFSVIGPQRHFEVKVNAKPITLADRDYFKNIEFIWYFGRESKEYADLCVNARKKIELANIVDASLGLTVTGWIGTFDERKSIEDGNNTIVVLAWGKLVQEDLLGDLDEGGIFTKYLIGDVRADFVDADNEDDIATSDRQRLREDDPRYTLLKKFVNDVVKKQVKLRWTQWRKEIAEERALERPAIAEWFKTLSADHKKYARELFGKIESLALPDAEAKKELYKQSILAFESLVLRGNLAALEGVTSAEDMDKLIKIIGNLDELESARYYQIVRSRLDVLNKFNDVKGTALEKILQKMIFDHLWLLDASWERAATDKGMEVIVGKEWKKVDKQLTKEEKLSRLDIKYRTAAKKNIVIELKKYNRVASVYDLSKQIGKYRTALQKVLSNQFPKEPQVIEFICVLGSPPKEWQADPSTVINTLRAVDARFITYDTLLKEARDSYGEYLEAEKKIARIQKLVDRI